MSLKMCNAPNPQQHVPRLEAVVCPLGFVQGYRCSKCCWAKLLPDAHVPWAVPFCYQVRAQKEFLAHDCQHNR
jgi:hypothetical protein